MAAADFADVISKLKFIFDQLLQDSWKLGNHVREFVRNQRLPLRSLLETELNGV
jgi:hypothetical protein